MERQTPERDFRVIVGIILILAIPAALTLLCVKEPRQLINFHHEPTPFGYTWSLLLFIIPAALIALWFFAQRELKAQHKAFWVTVSLLIPLGVLLDIFLGGFFFTFDNSDATLKIDFYGYLPGKGFTRYLPIEEIAFYVFGFFCVLLAYLWANEYWVKAYNRDDHLEASQRLDKIIHVHPRSLVIGLLLFAVGLLYKKWGPHPHHDGFPGYYTFLLAVGFLPSIVFFRTAVSFVNWRAFSLALFFMLFVSLLWEGTLGVPYQWWGYIDAQMLGLRIKGWSNLPIEEPLLWTMVSFTTVMVYEVVRIQVVMGREHFWEAFWGIQHTGGGVNGSAPNPMQRWPNSFLNGMREVGDPLADETVDKIFQKGELQAVNQLLHTLIQYDGMPPEKMPLEVRDYLDASKHKPAWAQEKLIQHAEQWFMDYGILTYVALFTASLPEAYACRKGVQVLWLTQKFEAHTYRRAMETGRFVLDVMQPGGLSDQNAGIPAIQKVRLMHAAIRHLILHGTDADLDAAPDFVYALAALKWEKSFGLPINQEDLAGTMLVFSYVMMRCLHDYGFHMERQDRDAYIHAWAVVGAMLGLRDDMLPKDYAEAEALFGRIKERQNCVSSQGQALEQALLQMGQDALPFNFLKPLPKILTVKMLGSKTSQILGLELSWQEAVVGVVVVDLMRLFDHLLQSLGTEFGLLRRLMTWVSRKVLEHVTRLPRGWERELFDIPSSLALKWGILGELPTDQQQ